MGELDCVDITGFRKINGTLFQASLSFPYVIPLSSGIARGVDLFWGFRMTPIKSSDGSSNTRVVLVSQTMVNLGIPTFMTNYMIGDILSDYIRSIEKKGQEYIKNGRDVEIINKYYLNGV